MNPFLVLLSLLAGAVISWLLVVRKVTVEVPSVRTAGDAVAGAAGAAVAARSAADRGRHADPVDYDHYADEPTDYVGEPTAYVQSPTPPVPARVGAARAPAWADRLDRARDGLAGAGARALIEPTASTKPAAHTAPGAHTVPGAHPAADSVPAPADGGVPAGYAVKGDTMARLYLLASDRDFERARPDIWFIDELAALDAGFSHFDRTRLKSAAG
jgi:hypothetical protein